MGTRADFYVGKTVEAEWLGSIGWDGYPDGIPVSIKNAATEKDYRFAVAAFLADRDDATMPDQGWPWPWDDSATTDYAYAYAAPFTYASCFGCPWFDARFDPPEEDGEDTTDFPNMKDRQNVTLGPRSGVMIISA